MQSMGSQRVRHDLVTEQQQMDLTFHVPMHLTIPSPPDISTAECHFCFGPASSFFLELLIIALCFSPVAYWTPPLGGLSTSDISFCLHNVHGVLMARILELVAISSSCGPCFFRTLHYDPPILGGPAWHSS